MCEIITERLVINNFNNQDANNLYELIQDYKKSEYYKYDHQWPEELTEYENIITWFSSQDTYLAVRIKEGNVFIGFVNLTKEDEEKENIYNLGFVFNSKYHNRGYAFEACMAYMNKVRVLHPDVKFVTGTAKDNIPANKLIKKLGFKSVKESRGSFQVDERNNPIIFESCEYRIE